MRLSIAICFALIVGGMPGALAARGGLPSVEWRRYAVADEDFSVLLPIAPAMTTSDVYLDRTKRRRERILGAYSDGVVYVIYTFERKRISLDELTRRLPPGQQLQAVTVNGIEGKLATSDTDERVSRTEFFATEKNLYMFEAVGSKLGDPAAGISKFFSSLSFQRTPEDNDVVDGPGDEPPIPADSGQDNPISGRLVTQKAKVITKPEPRYTEEARRNRITGTVVLRVVFSGAGAVTNIHAVSGLPDGLTERAIGAAKQIRFIPAIKDGHFVSMWIQLEYNFNLY